VSLLVVLWRCGHRPEK